MRAVFFSFLSNLCMLFFFACSDAGTAAQVVFFVGPLVHAVATCTNALPSYHSSSPQKKLPQSIAKKEKKKLPHSCLSFCHLFYVYMLIGKATMSFLTLVTNLSFLFGCIFLLLSFDFLFIICLFSFC